MNGEGKYKYGPMKYGWGNLLEFWDDFQPLQKTTEAHDFLRDYSQVYNMYPASASQPNPFSNKVMFLINELTQMGVKYSIDIFSYEGNNLMLFGNDSSHKLVNIIVEPNPNATGPAIVFCAHHDVANVRSENCQDNGASVCNLLRLAALVNKAKEQTKRVIILFSDSEESGARGARRFASKGDRSKENPSIIKHDIYGDISAVINLELTGKGTVVWSDCEAKKPEVELHEILEKTLGRTIPKLNTPPSDAIAFRRFGYPVLCIGILPEEDMKDKNTWRLCHSMNDTFDKCDRKNMEDFTTFLFNLTKNEPTENGTKNGANETKGDLCP